MSFRAKRIVQTICEVEEPAFPLRRGRTLHSIKICFIVTHVTARIHVIGIQTRDGAALLRLQVCEEESHSLRRSNRMCLRNGKSRFLTAKAVRNDIELGRGQTRNDSELVNKSVHPQSHSKQMSFRAERIVQTICGVEEPACPLDPR